MSHPIACSLRSAALQVDVAARGAELRSVRRRDDGAEYLWQAAPSLWGESAPLLFPVVGRLRGDRYRHAGRTHAMPLHGFAREADFTLTASSETRAELALRDSEATRERYPFAFELRVAYALEGARLGVSCQVSTPGPQALLFSIGGHPGFNCPLEPALTFADYHLELEREERAARWGVVQGLIGAPEPDFLVGRRIDLSPALFERGALVFKGLRSRWIRLASGRGRRGLTLDFAGFPTLGVWSKPGAPFVCLEPWHGIADAVGFDGELAAKEGILRLGPGQTFRCSFGVEFW